MASTSYNMGFFLLLVAAAAAAGSIGGAAASHEYKVGGKLGWREPAAGVNQTEFYNKWASRRRFQVGDTLYFEYKNDSVLVVDKFGYYHCNATNASASYTDGKTTFKLDKPGLLIYFISGAPGHCSNGQRLIVDVMAKHQHSPPGYNPDSAISPSPSPLVSSAIAATMASASSTSILLAIMLLLFLDSSASRSCSSST